MVNDLHLGDIGCAELPEGIGRPGEFGVEAVLGTFTLSSLLRLLCTNHGLRYANRVRGTL